MRRRISIYILFCLIFIWVCENPASAQKSKANRKARSKEITVAPKVDEPIAPPAKTSEKVDPSDFSGGVFKSEEGGFQIAFTALPQKFTTEITTAFGKTPLVRYEQPTSLITYGISYFDFPAAIKNPAEMKVRYDSARNRMMESLKVRLVDEKEIYFGDNFGKEFTFESDLNTFTERLFLIQQRFFQLSVATRGKISKLSEESQKFNREKIDRFMNSFSVTKLPEVRAVAVELPEDFGITVENSIFKSEFFNLIVPLPSGWHVLQKQETKVAMEAGKQKIDSKLPNQTDKINLSLKNTEILLMLTKIEPDKGVNDAVLGVSAEQVSFPNFLPEAIIKSYLNEAGSMAEAITIPLASTKFGGKDFAWCETANSASGLKKRVFVTNVRGIALEIFLIYRNQADLNLMLDSLKALKFANDSSL